MAFYPIDHTEPKNECAECGKLWDGNPYDYETDDHKFLCPECLAKLDTQIEMK